MSIEQQPKESERRVTPEGADPFWQRRVDYAARLTILKLSGQKLIAAMALLPHIDPKEAATTDVLAQSFMENRRTLKSAKLSFASALSPLKKDLQKVGLTVGHVQGRNDKRKKAIFLFDLSGVEARLSQFEIEERLRLGARSPDKPKGEADAETPEGSWTGSEGDCVHHWKIKEPAGRYSEGRCKKCGSTGSFKNSIDDNRIYSQGQQSGLRGQ